MIENLDKRFGYHNDQQKSPPKSEDVTRENGVPYTDIAKIWAAQVKHQIGPWPMETFLAGFRAAEDFYHPIITEEKVELVEPVHRLKGGAVKPLESNLTEPHNSVFVYNSWDDEKE